jgi:hypothetical protein
MKIKGKINSPILFQRLDRMGSVLASGHPARDPNAHNLFLGLT